MPSSSNVKACRRMFMPKPLMFGPSGALARRRDLRRKRDRGGRDLLALWLNVCFFYHGLRNFEGSHGRRFSEGLLGL